jgi:hypothetical protein
MFIARSLAFYPGFTDSNSQELSDEIIIPSYHLNKMMERLVDPVDDGARPRSSSHQQGFYNIIDFNKVKTRICSKSVFRNIIDFNFS